MDAKKEGGGATTTRLFRLPAAAAPASGGLDRKQRVVAGRLRRAARTKRRERRGRGDSSTTNDRRSLLQAARGARLTAARLQATHCLGHAQRRPGASEAERCPRSSGLRRRRVAISRGKTCRRLPDYSRTGETGAPGAGDRGARRHSGGGRPSHQRASSEARRVGAGGGAGTSRPSASTGRASRSTDITDQTTARIIF